MKRIIGVIFILVVAAGSGKAQFKNQPSAPRISRQLSSPTQIGSSFLNRILDLNRLHMKQSYSLTYFSSGGKGNTLGMYLNTLSYQISDQVDTRLQLGFTHSPFGGNNPYLSQNQFIGGAEINYRPSQNTLFQFQVSQIPGYYSSWYSSGFTPMFDLPSPSPSDGK